MFDETNENVTENTDAGQAENIAPDVPADTAENTAETQNPYLSQNETDAQDTVNQESTSSEAPSFSPIPEEPVKKSSNKVVIGVVIGAVVAALLLLVAVLAFTGVFSNKKATVLKALGATFTESGDYLKEVYGTEQYEGIFDSKEYTIDSEFDTDYYGLGIDVSMMQKEEARSMHISADMMGVEMAANIYTDDKEIVIELPEMIDYLLTINRETMDSDIQNLVEMGMLDQETVDELVALNEGTDEDAISEEAYEKFQKELMDTLKDFYNTCEMKKGDSKELTVNGKNVNCKGYVLVITSEDTADFVENLKVVYQDNEECLKSISSLYESSNLDSLSDLDSLYEKFDEAVEELRDMEDETAEIEFYLYSGKVAQIYFEGNDDAYIEWNIEGGNFPLENTSFTYEDEFGDRFVIERRGSCEDDKYQARYEAVNEYDESVAFEIQYKKNKGDFSLEILEDGDSFILIDGNIDKSDDNTVDIDIDTLEMDGESVLSGKMSIANICDDIKRPTGEEKEMLLLSEDEWTQVAMDILESFY